MWVLARWLNTACVDHLVVHESTEHWFCSFQPFAAAFVQKHAASSLARYGPDFDDR